MNTDLLEISKLQALPEELIEQILIMIPPEKIFNVCQSNKLLYRLSCNNPGYWNNWVDLPTDKIRLLIERGVIGDYYMEMKSGRLDMVRQRVEIARQSGNNTLDLSGLGIKYLPPGIFDGLSVKRINLDNNQITNLEPGVFPEGLRRLYLDN